MLTRSLEWIFYRMHCIVPDIMHFDLKNVLRAKGIGSGRCLGE